MVNTLPAEFINAALNATATPPFLTGSTAYTLNNSQPFITGRTFVFNPNAPKSGALGSFLLPLAQLRGLTRDQYNEFFALPNLPNTPRNNAIALVVVPGGTQFWSGLTGPITGPTGLFWGNGGGTQYYAGQEVVGSRLPVSNYLFPTPDNGGPVLVYGPQLSGNAQAIGSYLDQTMRRGLQRSRPRPDLARRAQSRQPEQPGAAGGRGQPAQPGSLRRAAGWSSATSKP